MLASFLVLMTVTAVVGTFAYRKDPANISRARDFALDQGVRIAIRLPFALFAASCLAMLIPDRFVAAVLGEDSGVSGIAIAALLGGILPGGPVVSFPLAIMFAKEGAGGPQVIALITGWSVYAFHRVLSYEIPIMGGRFAAVRMISSLFVPVAAGIGAGAIAAAFGWSLTMR